MIFTNLSLWFVISSYSYSHCLFYTVNNKQKAFLISFETLIIYEQLLWIYFKPNIHWLSFDLHLSSNLLFTCTLTYNFPTGTSVETRLFLAIPASAIAKGTATGEPSLFSSMLKTLPSPLPDNSAYSSAFFFAFSKANFLACFKAYVLSSLSKFSELNWTLSTVTSWSIIEPIFPPF